MALTRHTVLKFIGLAIGCLAKFVTGSLFTFNVYQDAIKETFNYTQKEVEVMSSMLNIGLGIGFLPGMLYDRFGPQWTSGAGLLVSVSAYILLWSTSTTKCVAFYRSNSWLMAIYFFFCGLGSVFTYMVALNTNVINFHDRHTGKVVGLLNAFFAGSPSIFATIFYAFFGSATDVENQNLGGFMLLFAGCFGVADILCVIFLRVYNETKTQTSPENSGDIHSIEREPNTREVIPFDRNKFEHLPLKKLLQNVDYHLLAWTFALASSIGLVFGNNLTVVSKSLHLDQYNDRLVLIIPITNATISLSIGIISDYFKEKVPRLAILIVGCCGFLACLVICFFLADKLAALYIATTIAAIGIGITWSISPTIMKEMFYIGNLGRNWGIALLGAAVLGMISQLIFGALYDANITVVADNYCYGMSCIRGGFSVFLGFACMSVICGLAMKFKKHLIRKCKTSKSSYF
ncbi:hypothetical protein CHS0354_019628 [Potamilus streckersoni]|uniref:Nodulin-like domain-containing protein n=1 Tax=Potamilus streckersoni TaxID=2493646 RepID=A0AAE0T964_9BIVA|nr:hypothetical protein CHS0354_019628 [Potamilus streckersoni]